MLSNVNRGSAISRNVNALSAFSFFIDWQSLWKLFNKFCHSFPK